MAPLDGTMTEMQYNHFTKQFSMIIKQFEDYPFTDKEITCLLIIYYKFSMVNTFKKSRGHFVRHEQLNNVFDVLFDFNDTWVITRIINVIADDPRIVTPTAWMNLFNIFLTDDLEKRMAFAFSVYDATGTGTLNSEQVSIRVESFFEGDDEDLIQELRSDMVELIFFKFDLDKDGVIDFQEYRSVVLQKPCLLEFLGQCFPRQEQLMPIYMCINMETLLGEVNSEIKKKLQGKPSLFGA